MGRYILAFFGGAVLGTITVMCIFDVKYPVYAPYYLEE